MLHSFKLLDMQKNSIWIASHYCGDFKYECDSDYVGNIQCFIFIDIDDQIEYGNDNGFT